MSVKLPSCPGPHGHSAMRPALHFLRSALHSLQSFLSEHFDNPAVL